MGEIVLKIPQRVARQYTLTKEYAAQILAELELKSRRLKSNPDETEKLGETEKTDGGLPEKSTGKRQTIG